MIRKILVFPLSITIAWIAGWSSASVWAQASLPSARGSAVVYAESARNTVEQLRQVIDRSHFDVEALIETLGWDPEAIIRFVGGEIEFEQYPGLLRGAKGTLMSRAGNSLDQAVLLATLLKDAGLDARIARAYLSQEQARQLLSGMPRSRAESPPPADSQGLDAIAVESGDEAIRELASPQPPTAEALDLVTTAANQLEELLRQSDPANPAESTARLLDEARDYFWVEYREGPASGWNPVHPALNREEAVWPDLEKTEVFAQEIPPELQHQFRLAVFIEQRQGDKLVVHQVVPDWQKPTANLLGRSFSISNFPNGLAGDLFGQDFNEAILKSEFFIPTLSGNILPGTQGFDLDGVPFDLDAQKLDSIGAAPLFRTMGKKTDAAVAALQGLGASGAPAKKTRGLASQWVEYTLIAPGGEEKATRRFLFDRVGPAARKSGSLPARVMEATPPWQVIASDAFMVVPGGVPAGLLLDEHANVLSLQSRLLSQREKTGAITAGQLKTALSETRGPEALSLLAMVRSFDNGLKERMPASTYRPKANLIALHWAVQDTGRLRVSTDIIDNDRRSRQWTDPIAARGAVLRQGVWETHAERLAIESGAVRDRGVDTPFSLFDDARNDRKGVELLLDGRSDRLAEFGLPADQQALIASQLKEGLAVALLPGQQGRQLAWWTIDPVTASTVGLLPDGRGATATEYIIGGILGAIVVTTSVKAMGQCLQLYWAEAELCTRGLDPFTMITDSARARVDEEQLDCFLSQLRWKSKLPEPDCYCGGLGEPKCPDWLPPKKRGPRDWW